MDFADYFGEVLIPLEATSGVSVNEVIKGTKSSRQVVQYFRGSKFSASPTVASELVAMQKAKFDDSISTAELKQLKKKLDEIGKGKGFSDESTCNISNSRYFASIIAVILEQREKEDVQPSAENPPASEPPPPSGFGKLFHRK